MDDFMWPLYEEHIWVKFFWGGANIIVKCNLCGHMSFVNFLVKCYESTRMNDNAIWRGKNAPIPQRTS